MAIKSLKIKNKSMFYPNDMIQLNNFDSQLGAIQKVRTLSRGEGVPKKDTKAYRGRGEVMKECTYAHNER